VTFKFYSSL